MLELHRQRGAADSGGGLLTEAQAARAEQRRGSAGALKLGSRPKTALLAEEDTEGGRLLLSEAQRGQLERDIEATDREIDEIVYGLYGLTEEEIKIVEGNS